VAKDLAISVALKGKDELSGVFSKATKNADGALGQLKKQFNSSKGVQIFKGVAGGVGMVASAMAGAAGVVGGLFAGITSGAFALANAANEDIDALGDLAAGTGIAVGELDRLTQMLKMSGVEAGQSKAMFKLFSKNLGDLQDPATGTARELDRVNGPMAKLIQTSGNATDALTGALDMLVEMPAGYQRTKTATMLFGRSSTDLLRILAKGPAAYRELRKEIEATGLLTDDMVAKSDAYGDAQDNMSRAIVGLKRAIGVELMPALTPAVESLAKFVNMNRGQIGSAVAIVAGNIGEALKNMVEYLNSNPTALKDLIENVTVTVSHLVAQIKKFDDFVADFKGFFGLGPDRVEEAERRAGVGVVTGLPTDEEGKPTTRAQSAMNAVKEEVFDRDRNWLETYSPLGWLTTGVRAAIAGASALFEDTGDVRDTTTAVRNRDVVNSAPGSSVVVTNPMLTLPPDMSIPAELAGTINVTFANAPAGMQVGTIQTNSPNVALAVKGNTGVNKTGSGGL
jgi:hypothetical protein